MNKRIIALISVLILVILAIIIWNYSAPQIKVNADDSAFDAYIESHTSGVISKEGRVIVRLASTLEIVNPIQATEQRKLFTVYPGVKGTTTWLDARTIEFTPDQPFKPASDYIFSFDLGKITEIDPTLASFNFAVRTMEPAFTSVFHGLTSQNSQSLEYMKFAGHVQLADREDTEKIEKLVRAQIAGKQVKIKWNHQPEIRKSEFVIDSLLKKEDETMLDLITDGSAIDSKMKGQTSFSIPEIGAFKVLDVRSINESDQKIIIQFSEPLMVAQDLDGLIQVDGVRSLQFGIAGSEITVYPGESLEGDYILRIHPGIENINEQKLTDEQAANIFFASTLPGVNIPGKGTILPGSGALTMPFEAVNLRAVDVTIVKIYANNVPQYFQDEYNSKYELRRVGKPVVRKTIRLDDDQSIDLRKKNRFSLDINDLIKTEPGAIYRVLIGFRQSYAIFPCEGLDETAIRLAEQKNEEEQYYYLQGIDDDDEFWARYDNYYPNGYRWDERDNPCHTSYYTQDRWVSRDMLASNIGLITKRGNDQSITVFATNILTTEPMQQVEISLLDYQQQILATGKTDAAGMIYFEHSQKPFMLVASKDNERGYLRMDDGASLPLSRFDVGGEIIQDGLKGFIYTERGVWRPGDSIFVGFILEDLAKKLPDHHPVIFELTDARGRLFERKVQTEHVNGFYVFKTATSNTAPTGNWLAQIKVGGANFTQRLKIETIMPNRLRIAIDVGKDNMLSASTRRQIHLTGTWLFGAPAQHLNARVETTLTQGRTAFDGYNDFKFDDPTRYFSSESQVLFDGTLDANGQAVFTDRITATQHAPGVLQANFTTRIFEPGGNFSIDYFNMPYSPYKQYVGLKVPQGDRLSGMLLTDKNHAVSIVLLDEKGKPVQETSEVQVELYKIRWSWWWNQEQEFLGNFTQDQYNQLLKKETISLVNGKADWNLRINYPDWGRYLIRILDRDGGHAAGQTLYVDWPGWAKREQINNPSEASMLSFTADKSTYQVGEEVTLTIPSSAEGRGLISIENGSRILKTEWIETASSQTVFKFKITADMAPNVFVNITLLQPHAQTINDLPIRMYGVIPLIVEDPNTILRPVIDLPSEIRPETKTKISIREQSGKNMTYTIAIVDEGLLDLTRFQTPDPHRTFYAREALGVKTWDLFDHVLGAWGGELERILSIGGDEGLDRNVHPAKANRFSAVIKFLGPYTLGKGRTNTHDFELPPYIGSVRAMVIAGQEGAYGFAEKNVAVKKPLMLLATLPRIIGPSESFALPLTVFATNKNLKNVQLEVTASGGLTVETPKQSLHFPVEGEQTAYFNITSNDQTGVGKIKATARSGSETAVYEVEIDIRNPNPFITTIDDHEVASGETWSQRLVTLGQSDKEQMSVEISTLPAINLTKRLNYLIRYPHGCLEQVISGVFPQLYVEDLTTVDQEGKRAIQRNVQAGLDRLHNYALPTGGFGYWPGARDADEWTTNYAGHFLIEAQSKGYTIPVGIMPLWLRFQKEKAQQWTPTQHNWRGGDLLQAYRLYVLALNKTAELGAMNRLKEFPQLSDEAAWRLAAAYQLVGQQVIAAQLVKGRKTIPANYPQAGSTFGSRLRDQAMILETLTLLGQRREAETILQAVASSLGRDQWYSTQTTAYALLAISKFMDFESGQAQFSYLLDGHEQKIELSSYLHRITINDRNQAVDFQLNNTGNQKLYVRVIKEGQIPVGKDLPATGNNYMDLEVKYTDVSGEAIDPQRIVQGTDFIVEIMVRNTGNIGTYENIAMTQIVAPGWEIINTRMAGLDAGKAENSIVNYQDIRDDRILSYYHLRQQETKTFRIQLNAAYIGRYYLPAIVAEAMYDNRINSRGTGQWVEVIAPPES